MTECIALLSSSSSGESLARVAQRAFLLAGWRVSLAGSLHALLNLARRGHHCGLLVVTVKRRKPRGSHSVPCFISIGTRRAFGSILGSYHFFVPFSPLRLHRTKRIPNSPRLQQKTRHSDPIGACFILRFSRILLVHHSPLMRPRKHGSLSQDSSRSKKGRFFDEELRAFPISSCYVPH